MSINIITAPEGVFWITDGHNVVRAYKSRVTTGAFLVRIGLIDSRITRNQLRDETLTVEGFGYDTSSGQIGRHRAYENISDWSICPEPTDPTILPMRAGFTDPAIAASLPADPEGVGWYTHRTHSSWGAVRGISDSVGEDVFLFGSGVVADVNDRARERFVASARSLGINPEGMSVYHASGHYCTPTTAPSYATPLPMLDETKDETVTTSQHEQDIATIGRILIDEAQSRSWCGEYDEIILRINQEISTPLPARNQQYRVIYTVPNPTEMSSDMGTLIAPPTPEQAARLVPAGATFVRVEPIT